MTVKFAKNAGNGIRTHNGDIDARPTLRHIAAIHLINAYVKYNQEVDEHQRYAWTDRVHHDIKEQGLRRNAGLTKDCVIKRKAFEVWEDELSRAPKPLALRSGDSNFPPNPSRHPEWVYATGRIVRDARPRAQEFPQGPQHPSQDINDDPWRDIPWGNAHLHRQLLHTDRRGQGQETHRAKLVNREASLARRALAAASRIQSVTQNTDYGLALKVYVKLGTSDWLKMYSRLYHGCDLHPYENLPTPAMLTVAALVNSEDDLQAAKEMRAKLSIGGNPDATTIRSQPTILCTDFELYAKNGATHFPLQNELMSKGWSQFVKFSPTISTVVNFSETQKVFTNLIDNLERMPQEQKSMAQENMEEILKDTYIKYFDKQNFAGYDAVGAYLTLQLRSHVFSTDKITEHEPQKHHHRGFAIYEKQLFCEKMISACFLNTQQLVTWEKMLRRKTADIKRLTEICVYFTQLHFSSTVNLNAWVSRDRRRAIEEETRRDDVVRSPEVEWQNFDIALSVPEPTYSEEQYWFKIDDYSTSDVNALATLELFFCELCEQEKEANIFCRDNTSFKSDRPQFPDRCIGCTYKYLYIQHFQDAKPGENLLEYIKKCCPLVYMSVGKVVSSYGGLRCPIATIIAHSSWGKAIKQLAWGRAYDAQNNLCFVAYYDAGNAAYAGFVKTLLTPQEREEVFRGSENPAEELLGDVFELSLGLLTFGVRYPFLFRKWGSQRDIKPCIYGIERDEAVKRDVEEIVAVVNDEERFLAVPSSAIDRHLRGSVGMGGENEVEEIHYDFSHGVDTSTLPQEDVRMDHEEPEGGAAVGESDALRIARAKAWDATRLLVHGSFDVNTDNPQNLCVLCGSSEHGFRACNSNSELKRVLCDAFEAMTNAITSFPEVLSLSQETTERRTDREGQASAASMDVDIEIIASSSTRRPKAKAMPRRGAHGAHAGIRVIEYDSPQVLGYAINRRRGERDACGESIFAVGLRNNHEVCKKIEQCTSHRDRKCLNEEIEGCTPTWTRTTIGKGMQTHPTFAFPTTSIAEYWTRSQTGAAISVILIGEEYVRVLQW
ncbi:unnamed protein product [Symbiodinium sp. CCMP2456]|nr:unnamed protein product [Symbiodinium sp. CCMP2456]